MVSNYRRKTDKASYSKETLKAAVRSVRNGDLSGYKAAQVYKIPRMTIMDHVKNKRNKSESLGRNTALSLEVEKKLASNLHQMEKHGFGLSKAEILEMVAEFVQKNEIETPFKNGTPGHSWFSAFKKRHNLSVKKPQAVEYARKKAMNPFIVYPYFDLLEKTINDLNLSGKPFAIWNLDETSFSKDPEKTKIVGLKGHAATRVISSPGKDNTTVLLGISAHGEKLPPLIIFKGKHMWDEWTSPEAYPGTTYAATKNGWMERDVFEMYFKKVFIPAVGDERPVLVIYDGHATHVGLNIIEEARNSNITILKLPAHTSHVLQPLDVAVMKSFKDRWDQLLVKWQRLNVGTTLSKKEFARLIGEVWIQIDSQVLRNGFRKTGIYPFNPKAVEEKLFDSLKLEHWKNLKVESQVKPIEVDEDDKIVQPKQVDEDDKIVQPKQVDEDDKIESSPIKNNPKSLLSLTLNCIINVAHTKTSKERDDQQHLDNCSQQNTPSSSFLCMGNDHSPNKQNETDLKNKNHAKFVHEAKKIQVLEDKYVTFEELLLMKIKAGTQKKIKRHRMGPGAELITHDDVLKRKMEENIKNIKIEPKEIKTKTHKTKIEKNNKNTKKEQKKIEIKTQKTKKSEEPGPSTSMQKKKKTEKKKQVVSDDSTSVSDCISEYSDSNICDSEHDFEEYMFTPEETLTTQNDKSKSDTIQEKSQGVYSKLVKESTEENYKEIENNNNTTDSNNDNLEINKVQDYKVNDVVLVRYFIRKNWTYYIGYVEEVKSSGDEIYYAVRFYKTVKKPLKFILTKKKDCDDVPNISIVKNISLSQNPSNPKELVLSNDADAIYFL